MKSRNRPTPRRGSTKIEVIVISLVMLSIGSFVLISFFHKLRLNAYSLENSVHLQEIHRGFSQHAQNDPLGYYPTPGMCFASADADVADRIRSRIDLNTTANLYSFMVAQNLVDAESLVSTLDPNNNIDEKSDYDQASYQPLGPSPTYWDPTFVADLHSESNASYAHTPIMGRRAEVTWRNTGSELQCVLSTRGPKDGADKTSDIYKNSLTLQIVGPEKKWCGELVFNDGSFRVTDNFWPPTLNYQRDGVLTKDNMFRSEPPTENGSEMDAVDVFLTFTKSMKLNTDGTVAVTTQFD